MNEQLLSIGRFARLAGLSVGALRHYDEAGVLAPAEVDRSTAYRRYHPDQLSTARAIAALRALDLSLPAIKALLTADQPAERAAILRDERLRIEARTARLQRTLHRLNAMAATAADVNAAEAASPRVPTAVAPAPSPAVEEIAVPTPHPAPELGPEVHRALAAGLFNRTWDLLAVERRTPAQDDELIDTAHASAWHWRQIGNAANAARSHWLCSRVYAVLGLGEAAVHHAQRAVAIVDGGGDGLEDWDGAAAAEAMARALAASGDLEGCATWRSRAERALERVADPEDRAVIERDLATLPG